MSDSGARLVAMVNDIADFFAVEPEREAAIAGITDHLRRFWSPRMRAKFLAHVKQTNAAGLGELAAAAAQALDR